MNSEKAKGRIFWNSNPIGGHWSSYKDKVQWARDTESYVYELLTEELLEGKLILDIGCGVGLVMPLAARYCFSVIGLDYSTTSLKEARTGFTELGLSNANLLAGDAESLPFPDNQFDVVYSLGVLHHTPDTSKAISELFRVLKPGGRAVIMLYRAYNPRWLAVKAARAFSNVVDRVTGEDFYIANRLRRKYSGEPDSRHGTALMELFGCPTLKMYSKRQACQMFSMFKDVRLQCYQPGLSRFLDLLPRFLQRSILERFFSWSDRSTANTLGFYLVIRAYK